MVHARIREWCRQSSRFIPMPGALRANALFRGRWSESITLHIHTAARQTPNHCPAQEHQAQRYLGPIWQRSYECNPSVGGAGSFHGMPTHWTQNVLHTSQSPLAVPGKPEGLRAECLPPAMPRLRGTPVHFLLAAADCQQSSLLLSMLSPPLDLLLLNSHCDPVAHWLRWCCV